MVNRKLTEIFEDFVAHIKDYLKNYGKYLGYDAAEKGIRVTSYILTNFIVTALAGLFFNVVFLTVVFYFGYVNDAMGNALLIIAVVYFVLAWLFILFRNPLIKKPIQKQMVRFIFTDPPTDDDPEK